MGETSAIDCSDCAHADLQVTLHTHINRHTYMNEMATGVSGMLRCKQSEDIFSMAQKFHRFNVF